MRNSARLSPCFHPSVHTLSAFCILREKFGCRNKTANDTAKQDRIRALAVGLSNSQRMSRGWEGQEERFQKAGKDAEREARGAPGQRQEEANRTEGRPHPGPLNYFRKVTKNLIACEVLGSDFKPNSMLMKQRGPTHCETSTCI